VAAGLGNLSLIRAVGFENPTAHKNYGNICDELAKGQKTHIPVIPVQTVIHYYQIVKIRLDSRFRGNDDFLRDHYLLLSLNL